MGERVNVRVITEVDGMGVNFYLHYGSAATLVEVVRAVANHPERWRDPSYLARIVCNAISPSGISVTLMNNEYPVIIVNPLGQIVSLHKAIGRQGYNLTPSQQWPFDLLDTTSANQYRDHWMRVDEMAQEDIRG